MKEGKTPGPEPQRAPSEVLPDLPAGLLGLEIPPDVRNVLKVILTPFLRVNFCGMSEVIED